MNRLPGLGLTDHTFKVPLDHTDSGSETIEVFARAVCDPARSTESLPWLVYLEGGPGARAPRPTRSGGWLAHALQTHRVLLLDQRGTGRSTPVTGRTIANIGDDAAIADYLRHFRADSIVADCELIRHQLCDGQPWETLGQSYGGFITLTYLSRSPEALRACYITGGLPGLNATAEDVYARTYPRIKAKSAAFYGRYPQDRDRVRRIVAHLRQREVLLPDGDLLSVPRLQMLGLAFGMGDGLERTHWILDSAFDGGDLSDAFLYQVMAVTSLADRPLFAVLQESIYGQGDTPTAWAAQRACSLHTELASDADPMLFTGEAAYPWMFEEIRSLRPFAGAVNLLAAVHDWPPLYDLQKLACNQVPVAAAVFHSDMYVDAELSLSTSRQIPALRTWVTNEWEHDALGAAGETVLARLMDMASGRV